MDNHERQTSIHLSSITVDRMEGGRPRPSWIQIKWKDEKNRGMLIAHELYKNNVYIVNYKHLLKS